MLLKANILKLLKLFASDSRTAIVGYIVISLILLGGGVRYLTKTTIITAFQIANIPTPLWATTGLVLLSGLLIHIRSSKSHSLPKASLADFQIKLLILLAQKHEWTAQDIASVFEVHIEVVNFHLQKLKQRNMITASIAFNRPSQWSIDQEGRRYSIEHNELR